MSSKVCCKCEQEKPVESFHKKFNKQQPYCIDCKKKIDLKRTKSGQKNLNQYLKDRCNHRCFHCHKQFVREVLEFHHPAGVVKTMDLDAAKWRGLTGPRTDVVAEADQCWVLCANCHRIEHVRIKNEGSDTGHRDGRAEANESVGSRDQGHSHQGSFNFEEPNT